MGCIEVKEGDDFEGKFPFLHSRGSGHALEWQMHCGLFASGFFDIFYPSLFKFLPLVYNVTLAINTVFGLFWFYCEHFYFLVQLKPAMFMLPVLHFETLLFEIPFIGISDISSYVLLIFAYFSISLSALYDSKQKLYWFWPKLCSNNYDKWKMT